jgi:hypothetical protein
VVVELLAILAVLERQHPLPLHLLSFLSKMFQSQLPVISALAANVSPTKSIDTKISQDGLQTTITIMSVTTVVIDDLP